jgi:amidase
MDDVIFASATALAREIRARRLSAEEVVTAYLRRIGEVNGRLNAAVQVPAEAALAAARAADVALAHGAPLGPLHGVPFTVKDIFDTAGVITAAGLPERAAYVPLHDATVVARMRAAGGILLGKTNCPPGGAGGDSANAVYGTTNNPYDLERTPGGSSGREAALIAVGGSPVGLGSDSGGSLRLPAHYCGVATLRPTAGRVPATGGFALTGGLSDVRTQGGPLARYVADLALVLPVIAGVDWRDSAVVPMPLGDPGAVALSSLRVAFYTDDGIATPTPETVSTVQVAAQALATAGLTVVEERPPLLQEALVVTRSYWSHAHMSGDDYDAVLLEWDRVRTALLAFMESRDVLLCPVSDRPALPHGTVGDERFSYCLPYSLSGYPCAVVRAGTSPEGLPLGVQVVARPWREDVALAVAQLLENALGGWRRPDDGGRPQV